MINQGLDQIVLIRRSGSGSGSGSGGCSLIFGRGGGGNAKERVFRV